MFQNIADMDAQEENIKENNTIYRLKNIFRYQNIIIYILTFLMSTLSIKGNIVPFGLAMVAACVGETVPLGQVVTVHFRDEASADMTETDVTE